jgi:ABC-2 type transport system permease protein
MVREYSNRTQSLFRLLMGLVIVMSVVVMSGFLFNRFDLTEEKRHTLKDATIEMLENLEDVVFVKVYLKGEYPAEYKRLEREIKERLDEMKAYAGARLEYEFINPSESEDNETRNKFYQFLQDEGLQYTNITFRTNDGISEKIIFPGAIITYRGESAPLQLLKSNERAADPEIINNSVINLEYEFAHTIRRVTSKKKPSIAFIQGHSELSRMETADAEKLLSESYQVARVEISGQLNSLSTAISEDGKQRLNSHDLLIIADPDSTFSDTDMFLLDQYIMRGGKIMWFVDPIMTDLDSLRTQQQTMGLPRKLGIEEMLFDYGVRLNNNILLDRNCAPIGITTGMRGNQPQIELFPWYFQPKLVPRSQHPIVGNIDPILTEFVSSIDTISQPGVKKTILLTTSEFTRVLRPPVRINLNIVSIDPDFGNKKQPYQPVAVILEGQFESAFKNRISPTYIQEGFKFVEKSLNTSMLIVSDGDILKNKLSSDGKNYFTLGYDRYTQNKIYGNREFLLNAVNYMLDETSLISIRTKGIKLRQLDQEYLMKNKGRVQAFNMLIPLLLILILGLVSNFMRKMRYSKSEKA